MNRRFQGRASARCKFCGAFHVPSSPGGSLGLEVHHVSYEPEKTIWLCRPCHVALHCGRFPDLEASALSPLQLERARLIRLRRERPEGVP